MRGRDHFLDLHADDQLSRFLLSASREDRDKYVGELCHAQAQRERPYGWRPNEIVWQRDPQMSGQTRWFANYERNPEEK